MPTKPQPKTAPRSRGKKIRRIAHGLAQTTLLAAALAAAQLSPGEREPEPRLFNLSMLDKLQPPLTRVRE